MMIKIDKKNRFLFLLGLIFFSNFLYAQELKVLEHIPAKEIESYLYEAVPQGIRAMPVTGGWNLAVSPNGKFIGFWSAKNLSVKVMDLETREIIAELDDVELKDLKRFTYTPIWGLVFSPDSRYLAIVLDKPSVVKLWDFKGPPSFSLKQTDAEKTTAPEDKETNQKVINLKLPDIDEEDLLAKKEPAQIAFSLDEKYLATSVVTKIYLWDTTNWQIIHSLKSPIFYGTDRPGGERGINGLIFSPDSKYLVSRYGGGHLSVWELYETIETEEYKNWDKQATKCEEKVIMQHGIGPGNITPLTLEEQERLKDCRRQIPEPSRYLTIFAPHLFLPDIGSAGPYAPLILTDSFLISGYGLRLEFNPGLWKSEMETEKALGLEPEKGFKAKVKEFATGPWGGRPVAVFGDLIAIGAPDDKREPAKIFRLSDLKEIISFNTVKDKNTPDKTNLIFFFPDGKRLLSYNHLEGIYIFDISMLEK